MLAPAPGASAPVASEEEASRASRVAGSALRRSFWVWGLFPVAVAARLGSARPMTGTAVARTVWKGAATKRPSTSNQAVKERASSTV